MEKKCKKIPEDSLCMPQALIEIKGKRRKRLTKLEAFFLSTIIYFKKLKMNQDSSRTVADTMKNFFALTSIHQVLNAVLNVLIEKNFIKIDDDYRREKKITKTNYGSVPLDKILVTKEDDVFYDEQAIDYQLAVDLSTGRYQQVQQEKLNTCLINESIDLKMSGTVLMRIFFFSRKA